MVLEKNGESREKLLVIVERGTEISFERQRFEVSKNQEIKKTFKGQK